jgi:predicted transglutaminase-like cysteine proteinase
VGKGISRKLNKIVPIFPIRQQCAARILMTSKLIRGGSQMTSKFSKVLFAGVALIAASFAALPAQAAIPPGMRAFCASHGSECVSGAAKVAYSDELMSLMRSVNSQVNRSIRFKSDVGDVWTLNPRSGDCEDYAITKRSALIRQGVSPGALRIAFTFTRRGVPHAILVVRTDKGDYVLDNLSGSVRGLASTRYPILSMSGSNPRSWSAAG